MLKFYSVVWGVAVTFQCNPSLLALVSKGLNWLVCGLWCSLFSFLAASALSIDIPLSLWSCLCWFFVSWRLWFISGRAASCCSLLPFDLWDLCIAECNDWFVSSLFEVVPLFSLSLRLDSLNSWGFPPCFFLRLSLFLLTNGDLDCWEFPCYCWHQGWWSLASKS